MKLPKELANRLGRQWSNNDLREQRLLDTSAWPLKLPIGKPSAKIITNEPEKVRVHVQQWRDVTVGQVDWENVQYRSTNDSVAVPVSWALANHNEWVAAIQNRNITKEFNQLKTVLRETDVRFHPLFARQRNLIATHSVSELVQAAKLAMLLESGCAQGAPLRALSLAGIDSKFFERHRSLMIRLLDIRFDGLATELGLETFLNAASDRHHWLLVADLDGDLLPFEQLRVRDDELQEKPLPGTQLIIVENERCLHQLPKLKNTVAVLGAGLNLTWMHAGWLRQRRIAYWGDIDTWGLNMLAQARKYEPNLQPILMNRQTYDAFCQEHAVEEPTPSSTLPPDELSAKERALFATLLEATKGRLEQEFLPRKTVHNAFVAWVLDE